MESIREAIRLLTQDLPLSEDLAGQVAGEILEARATPSQMGAFLMALRIRGEQPEHLRAFARIMRFVAQPVELNNRDHLVDTCGTGGDGANTFNISTAAGLVAAGAGARVAKHGNRAVTGLAGSGSADVLAALGVQIECSSEASTACINQCGFGFFFAPFYHQAMRHAGPTRREIGVRTILNLLGPLANPAGALHQVIGVSQPELTDVFARVLADLGAKHVLVVHGLDGLDEVSLLGPTRVSEAVGTEVRSAVEITPEQFGFKRCSLEELKGGETAEDRAAQIRAILLGEKGPRRDITLLNAAAALLAADLAKTWDEGVRLATQSIDSGAALRVVENLAQVSHSKVHA